MKIERFAGRPGRPYVPAIKAAPFVFTAGYTGFRADGSVPEDFEEQVRIILDRARTNLEKAGSSLREVVSATVYLTDQARDREKLDEMFAEFFGDTPPTRCCVEVQALSGPLKRVEIQFVAVISDEN
jgi:2-iminobutanoate/2-iminopropanoate deaminase